MPAKCPSCTKPENNFIKKGIGTQQVVHILQKIFPRARIARADMDTTSKKKTWQQTVHDFEHNNLDVLVGTQTVTKGFHFPHVTLVGILWADLNLHFPVFNATEQTLQQLIQVAGRAGRSSKQSEVIIQTMEDHHVYHYLNETDYLQFYRTEIEKRSMLGYPPTGFLAEIEIKNNNEAIIDQDALHLAQELEVYTNQFDQSITILGPAKPPIHKIQGTHTRTILLKAEGLEILIRLFAKVDKKRYKSALFFTPVF